ncbi:hypothetical protein LTR70_001249 [Exophiala xenobiotica]|uniref:Uncharacterized protein n=1 Tax=Lithohypha guttulata TaxID=1690604 RepID=A0ABR0KKR5_9EURO|nr:hypothetical protein LTR24_001500 [Lithohypha guttulata]KAK5328224.1 hypothetical protein LTR70_001249 [Exophiala xenobiotica]
MDSMRSLNRSLPSTPPTRPAPPEQLLQAFRQAALSVTNLYKSAASDHDSIRQAGYSDAIDDLLKFLDRENLGLQDGEGWRIRQWATAKYDASYAEHSEAEEEDASETEPGHRSDSPEKATESAGPPQESTSLRLAGGVPEQVGSVQVKKDPQQPVFQFSAGNDNAMQTDAPEASSSQEDTTPVQLQVINRTNRNSHKYNNRHTPRSTSRPATQAAGSKRKLPFPDMSEIFNISFDKKDNFDSGSGGGGGGGGKRSRLV